MATSDDEPMHLYEVFQNCFNKIANKQQVTEKPGYQSPYGGMDNGMGNPFMDDTNRLLGKGVLSLNTRDNLLPEKKQLMLSLVRRGGDVVRGCQRPPASRPPTQPPPTPPARRRTTTMGESG